MQASYSPCGSFLKALAIWLVLAMSGRAWATDAVVVEPYRILVLHGIWDADEFQLRFDAALADRFSTSENVEISTQYLGLNMETSTAGMSALRTFVVTTIAEREVDLVVGLLPGAVDFLLSLDLDEDFPKLLVLPNRRAEAIANGDPSIVSVPSIAPFTLRKTIEHVRLLKPDVTKIAVMAGADSSDQVYLNLLQSISREYFEDVRFEYHVGTSPTDLIGVVSRLEETSVLLNLPYNSYIDENAQLADVPRNAFRQVVDASSVPVFSFYENEPGVGITGGYVSSIDDYVNAASQHIKNRIAHDRWANVDPRSGGRALYDWQQLRKWRIDLGPITGEVEVINEPLSLWESNRTLVLFLAFAGATLLVIQLFTMILLRRSRTARLRIAASERLVRESEAKFRLLAMNTIDVIWTWNPSRDAVSYCSPSVERLTGFSVEESMNRKLTEAIAQESIGPVEALLRDRNRVGQVLELEHNTKSGGRVWCEMTAQPVVDSDEDEWIVVTRDITARKALESERDAMEDAVRQTQKFESLGTLAGGVAHDFNNILAVIVGVTEMLRESLPASEDATDLLDKLEGASKRATALVKQILTFSRQSDGRREVIDLAAVVGDAADLPRASVPASINLQVRLGDDGLTVFADRTQIEQVVINLLTNAVQALRGVKGDVTLALSRCDLTRPRKFSHGGILSGDFACLEVRDTGTGIARSNLDRIFDPFFTSKELGSGMGLAIVRGVVTKHGGAIEVRSEVGSGTTFSIYLPLTTRQPEARPADSAPTRLANTKLRLLLIDDQTDVLEVVAMMGEQLGHDVTTSADPDAALEMLRQEHFDLVITDYSMPRITGMDIVEHCRKSYPELPVVLISGYGETLPEIATERDGGVRILQKPIDQQMLATLLDNVIRNSPLHIAGPDSLGALESA